MDAVASELRARWQQMLERVQAGDDIPPALRLRAEGLMEALVIAGAADAASLQAELGAAWEEAIGSPLDATLGPDWAAVHPFPAIPFYMARAPVVPSGDDDL